MGENEVKQLKTLSDQLSSVSQVGYAYAKNDGSVHILSTTLDILGLSHELQEVEENTLFRIVLR